MPRLPSPAIGLIRALVAAGLFHQAARSLTRLPAPPPSPATPATQALPRRHPASSSSAIHPPPPAPHPRPSP